MVRLKAIRSAILLAPLALVACGESVDPEMAAICRMTLPALNAAGARIAVTRVAPGADARTVRVEYSVTGGQGASPAQGLRRRYVVCAFSATPPSGAQPDLVGIDTDTGPVTGASVYLMKRYWLSTPEAREADPGR
ncbi:MAG: hypothetical protein EA385_13435 [Salinarimonadaceae bacterium]|nr:MAG: hypothetical protein EA385_13435 [Salinarimonadaceae bacterium]